MKRHVLVTAAVSMMFGALGGASVQWFSAHLGSRIHVGDRTPVHSAAQIQAVGKEGGVAVVAHNPADENYFVGFQPLYDGSPLYKNFSLSTMVRDRDPITGYYITRLNTAYLDNGKGTDDIQVTFCGGHGTIWNPDSARFPDCPGDGNLVLNGDVRVTGTLTVNGKVYRSQ